MKTALFSIFAKHAYAQTSGAMAAAAGHQPIEVALATTTTANDPSSPAFGVTDHLLEAEIDGASGVMTLNGDWAENYVNDIQDLMPGYDATAADLSAEYDIEIYMGTGTGSSDLMSHYRGNSICTASSLFDGTCEVSSLPLFTQLADFEIECEGKHVHGNSAGSHNSIADPSRGRVVGTIEAGAANDGTAGIGVFDEDSTATALQTMDSGKYVWHDDSTTDSYDGACAFSLDYAFDVKVSVRVYEAGVQIGSTLSQRVTVDLSYSFSGYDMKPNYDGVLAQVTSGKVTPTVLSGTFSAEEMSATVQNNVAVADVDLTCVATLIKAGATTELDAVWVYQMIVNGCTRPGPSNGTGILVRDTELLLQPAVTDVNANALFSDQCLQTLTGAGISPVAAAELGDVGAACALTVHGAESGTCADNVGQDDSACVYWTETSDSAAQISHYTANVDTQQVGPKLAIAVARFDEDVQSESDPDKNEFSLWFYVRLSDASYVGAGQAQLTLRLPLDAVAGDHSG